MNKKGFTLAEVLGVVVILGLLVIVSFPPILNQLKKSQSRLSGATIKLLGSAAELYVDEHPSSYPIKKNNVYCFSLKKLVDTGYLKSPILDASSGEQINEEGNYIKFTINDINDYRYDLVTECTENR